MEILYTVVYLIAFWLVVPVWDTDLGIDGWLGWALFFVWIALAGKGLLEWSSTDFVVTNRRVIFRRGVMTKVGYEIPIDRVQDVGFRQGVLQRIVGAGDLLVQSSASEGQTAIRDITDPLGLKKMITDVRGGRSPTVSPAPAASLSAPAAPAAPPPTPAVSSKSTAEQLEILARLHTDGSLSVAEFQAEKAKLLGQ
ncbi:MAG: PH domain-containing protein [Actinomycetota bacterium]|nr:PH domain-containing protein [Actinomycetota bacterium]